MPASAPQYDALTRRFSRIHRFVHLQQIAYWDQAANMPPHGNEARSQALAEIASLLHRLRTDPGLGGELEAARDEPLDEAQAAHLREMRRVWLANTALPEALVERRALVTSRCEHAWRSQRPANDWAGFLPNLKEVVANTRECALRLSERSGLSPYDALIDQYEPGMTTAKVRQVFDPLREWLPGLIRRVVEKQAPISEVLLVLDATTGQNGLAQAEAFIEHGGVTGLVITKLDGSAKGGFVLAVQEKTGLPIKLIGQGEGINDLTGFTPHVFAQKLIG